MLLCYLSQYLPSLSNDVPIPGCRKTGNDPRSCHMKTTITNDQIATFTKRSAELYRRLTEGTLPAEAVLAGMQKLVEGQFPSPTTLAEMIKAGRYDWTNDDI